VYTNITIIYEISTCKACVLDNELNTCVYILWTETPRPNTNKYIHAHKCLYSAGIESGDSVQ
jgi:hypothetical protein